MTAEPTQTAAQRFCDHGDLLSYTLDFLNKRELVACAPVFLEHVAARLYSELNEYTLECFSIDSPRTRLYCSSVRRLECLRLEDIREVLQAFGINRFPRPTSLTKVLNMFPNVTSIGFGRRNNQAWHISPDGQTGGGSIKVRTNFALRSMQDVYEPPWKSVALDLVYPGWNVLAFSAVDLTCLRDRAGKSPLACIKNMDWAPHDMQELFMGQQLPWTIGSLTEFAGNRNDHGSRPMTALSAHLSENYTIDEFEALGKSMTRLTRLKLSGKALRVATFCELAQAIHSCFPLLKDLSLEIERAVLDKENPLPDQEILTMGPMLRWGALEAVYLRDWRPIIIDNLDVAFAMALEVACIGGVQCSYYLDFLCDHPQGFLRDLRSLSRKSKKKVLSMWKLEPLSTIIGQQNFEACRENDGRLPDLAWTTEGAIVPDRLLRTIASIKIGRESLKIHWQNRRHHLLEMLDRSDAEKWTTTLQDERTLCESLVDDNLKTQVRLDDLVGQEKELFDGALVEWDRSFEADLLAATRQDKARLAKLTELAAGDR